METKEAPSGLACVADENKPNRGLFTSLTQATSGSGKEDIHECSQCFIRNVHDFMSGQSHGSPTTEQVFPDLPDVLPT